MASFNNSSYNCLPARVTAAPRSSISPNRALCDPDTSFDWDSCVVKNWTGSSIARKLTLRLHLLLRGGNVQCTGREVVNVRAAETCNVCEDLVFPFKKLVVFVRRGGGAVPAECFHGLEDEAGALVDGESAVLFVGEVEEGDELCGEDVALREQFQGQGAGLFVTDEFRTEQGGEYPKGRCGAAWTEARCVHGQSRRSEIVVSNGVQADDGEDASHGAELVRSPESDGAVALNVES
ncbi:hypothetical protein MKX08_005147 [Trichoderma sp. CBMAI-0020]|nr:hypothetical protein MKX08_005147 [Trichoderma sp. CBMAI-0020]